MALQDGYIIRYLPQYSNQARAAIEQTLELFKGSYIKPDHRPTPQPLVPTSTKPLDSQARVMPLPQPTQIALQADNTRDNHDHPAPGTIDTDAGKIQPFLLARPYDTLQNFPPRPGIHGGLNQSALPQHYYVHGIEPNAPNQLNLCRWTKAVRKQLLMTAWDWWGYRNGITLL